MELLKNAWAGWLAFTDAGKLAALLIAVILFYCFTENKVKRHVLFIYTTTITALCIFPVSAALLMVYQTKFYDYQWIWTYVPVTALTAFGGTVFLCDFWEDCKRKYSQKLAVTLGLLAVLLLCGRMGNDEWKTDSVSDQSAVVENLLSEITKDCEGTVCLWAPQEIVEYARMVRGDVQLFYGRNMWDKALNAYSYDVYPKEKEICYQWMEYAQEWGGLGTTVQFNGETVLLSGVECMENARKLGANVICLPGKMSQEALDAFETELGMTFERYGEWLVWMTQKRN